MALMGAGRVSVNIENCKGGRGTKRAAELLGAWLRKRLGMVLAVV